MRKKENPPINKQLKYLIDNRKYFFSILVSIIFAAIIAYRVHPLFSQKSTEGHIIADKTYNDWKNSSFEDNKSLAELRLLLKKYPNLQTDYEAMITQDLIQKDLFTKDDILLADKAISRTNYELPFYSKYAIASVLITKKEFIKALEKAKILKTEMQNDLSFLKEETLPAGPILYSLNLLRIAFLEKILNNNKAEFSALEELENYLGLKKDSRDIKQSIKEAINIIKSSFNENNIELIDYITYRKSLLSSEK